MLLLTGSVVAGHGASTEYRTANRIHASRARKMCPLQTTLDLATRTKLAGGHTTVSTAMAPTKSLSPADPHPSLRRARGQTSVLQCSARRRRRGYAARSLQGLRGYDPCPQGPRAQLGEQHSCGGSQPPDSNSNCCCGQWNHSGAVFPERFYLFGPIDNPTCKPQHAFRCWSARCLSSSLAAQTVASSPLHLQTLSKGTTKSTGPLLSKSRR